MFLMNKKFKIEWKMKNDVFQKKKRKKLKI